MSASHPAPPISFVRLGLLGDAHANTSYLEAALRFFDAQRVDAVLCTGDVADGAGDVNRCCELLQKAGAFVVRGNHDRWLLENQSRDLPDATQQLSLSSLAREFLGALPRTRTLETVAGSLLLCHGVGANDMARLMPDDYGYALECQDELQALLVARDFAWVVGGHTHHRMVRRFDGLTFLNPGTLFARHEPCLALADFGARRVWFHDFADGDVGAASQEFAL